MAKIGHKDYVIDLACAEKKGLIIRKHALQSINAQSLKPLKKFGRYPDRMDMDNKIESTGFKYIADFIGGYAWGESACPLTKNLQIVRELVPEFPIPIAENAAFFGYLRHGRPEKVGGSICCCALSAGNNFYHWMVDHIPRYKLLKDAGLMEGCKIILSSYSGLSFQNESLQALDIPVRKIIKTERKTFLQSDHIYYPSRPSRPPTVDAWAVGALRDIFLPEWPRKARRRAFISRRHARRRILNEHNLEHLLKKYGIEIVEPECMTLKEQVRYFSECEWMVGAHGAALTHIVFTPPCSTLIEIHPWWDPAECIKATAIQAQAKYIYVAADPCLTAETPINRHTDIIVSEIALKAAFEYAESIS